MTDDIVARLRSASTQRKWWPRDRLEAADEIERLRAALKLAQNLDDPLLLEIERLRAEIEALEGEIRETAEACHD